MDEFVAPRIIYSLWLQGKTKAPALCLLCWERWARLNPRHQLRILEAGDVERLLCDFPVPLTKLRPQALANIVRTRLLRESGGIWTDATVFPMSPVEEWMSDGLKQSGFFAFETPGPDRPLSNWLLAASPHHLIVEKWWVEIQRFWVKPRELATFGNSIVPPDPAWQVAPNGGALEDSYPYYWHHYLFRYLLEKDEEIRSVWGRCTRPSAEPPHRLQRLFKANAAPPLNQIIEAASSAPVQKLNWRHKYPLDVLSRL